MELICNRCKHKKLMDCPYIYPWFSCPLTKICLCDLCHSSFQKLKYDIEKKLLNDFIQPERLNPEDERESRELEFFRNNMGVLSEDLKNYKDTNPLTFVCDSLTSTNK